MEPGDAPRATGTRRSTNALNPQPVSPGKATLKYKHFSKGEDPMTGVKVRPLARPGSRQHLRGEGLRVACTHVEVPGRPYGAFLVAGSASSVYYRQRPVIFESLHDCSSGRGLVKETETHC